MVTIRIKNRQSDNWQLLGSVCSFDFFYYLPNTCDNRCVPMDELVVGKVVVAGA
jgi:hypothetical protein